MYLPFSDWFGTANGTANVPNQSEIPNLMNTLYRKKVVTWYIMNNFIFFFSRQHRFITERESSLDIQKVKTKFHPKRCNYSNQYSASVWKSTPVNERAHSYIFIVNLRIISLNINNLFYHGIKHMKFQGLKVYEKIKR